MNDDNLDMTAKELAVWLTLMNMRPKELAELLGCSVTAVNFWLNGRRNIPEPIARILDLMARRPELINEF